MSLDRKLYNNAIEEILLDTYKFKKLSEDPTMKCEASLQRCLHKLKQKNFFRARLHETQSELKPVRNLKPL